MADSAAGRHFMSAGFLFESTRAGELTQAPLPRPQADSAQSAEQCL
jgi:hypothetical protein